MNPFFFLFAVGDTLCPSCSCLADTWSLYQGLVWPALALLTLGRCTKALSDLLLPCWHLVVVPRPCLTCSCLADTWLLYQGLVWPALALLTLVLTRPCLSYSCLADTYPTKAVCIRTALALQSVNLSVLLFTLPTLACPTKVLSVGQPWHNAQEHSLCGCSNDHLFRGQQLGCCVHVFLDTNFLKYYYFLSSRCISTACRPDWCGQWNDQWTSSSPLQVYYANCW